jgi:hypothetical protein
MMMAPRSGSSRSAINDAKLRGLAVAVDAHELSQAGHLFTLQPHLRQEMLDAPSEMTVAEENGEAVRRPWIREEQR